MVQRILIFVAFVFSPVMGISQVAYDALRTPVTLSAGGYYSYFDGNYAGNHLMGAGAYVDYSPLVLDQLGVEAEGRWLNINGTHGFSETTYLIGPQYRFVWGQRKRLHPYAKALVGIGEINFPYQLAHGNYLAIAPGGGADFALNLRWRLRADYEYQLWPSAPGIPGVASAMLKPNGVSVGVSYRIF